MIRRRLRIDDGTVVLAPRQQWPVRAESAGDRLPPLLPGWRLPDAWRPDRQPGEHKPSAVRVDPSGDCSFRSDRRAARYAPEESEYETDGRSFAVLTLSLSGLSLQWDATALPSTGAKIDGMLRPGDPIGAFPAAFAVTRLDRDRRLVAGCFVGLTGRAIDALLAWLVRLDRGTAKR